MLWLVYRDGMRWAHVSCALWIPEIVIGDTEKMEPISNISDIPVCRVFLVDVLYAVRFATDNNSETVTFV